MTLSKVLYISAIVFLFPLAITAQETAASKNQTSIVSIQDLHKATATDLLTEDANGEVVLSQEYYDAGAIPDRVARLIKESLIEDTMLATQTKNEFETRNQTNAILEEEVVAIDVQQEHTLPVMSFTSGGGLE